SPSHATAAFRQRPSRYAEAALARQKKIFAGSEPIHVRSPAREDNAVAISKAPSASRVQFAAGVDSSALQFQQPNPLPTKRPAHASCPKSRKQKRPRPPAAPHA